MKHFNVFIYFITMSILCLSSCGDVLSDAKLGITGESKGEWNAASSAYPSWVEDMEAVTITNSQKDSDEDVQAFIRFQSYSNYWCAYARDVYSFTYGSQTFIAVHDEMLGTNTAINNCCDELTLFFTTDGRRIGNKNLLYKQFEKNSTLLWSNRLEYGNNIEKRVPGSYKFEGCDRTDLLRQSVSALVEEVRLNGETIGQVEFWTIQNREGVIMTANCLSNDNFRYVCRRIGFDGNVSDLSSEEFRSLNLSASSIYITPEDIKGYVNLYYL